MLQTIAVHLGHRRERIAMQDLAKELTEEGTEPMTPTRLGIILKKLGVSTRRSTGGYTVVSTNLEEVIEAYRGLGEEPSPLLLAEADSYATGYEPSEPKSAKDEDAEST